MSESGIENFYQQKVKEAKEMAAHLKTLGVDVHYEDLLDAKDIWYEYCDLLGEQNAEDIFDLSVLQEFINKPQNEW